MDSGDLNLSSHIKESTESAYYHLKNTWRTDRFMSHQDMEKLVHVFIFSQLHHCSGVFTVLSAKIMNKQLQMSQNAAAQVLTQTKKLDQITQFSGPLSIKELKNNNNNNTAICGWSTKSVRAKINLNLCCSIMDHQDTSGYGFCFQLKLNMGYLFIYLFASAFLFFFFLLQHLSVLWNAT